MTNTANYQLPQWEASDRVKRSDFNAAMQSIDTALAGAAKIAAGTYTGNGAATQFIDLGATPKAVFVLQRGACTYSESSNIYMGGLALPNMQGTPAVCITTGGFNACSSNSVYGNYSDVPYTYLAFF